jgi:large subunit ribosomal protein L24
MAAAKIKKGDSVFVRSGKDKGRTGTVLQVMPKDGKVLVQGVNVATRHREAPMHVCKVALADPKSGKPTRVRFETGKDGVKVRIAVKSGEKIDG